jgi:hypothetical protein
MVLAQFQNGVAGTAADSAQQLLCLAPQLHQIWTHGKSTMRHG